MDRFVVMVDAGYLLRQATKIISNKATAERRDLDIADPEGLIQVLLRKARATLNLEEKELLRIYWYDGVMPSGLTPQQRSLVNIDDVQLRAGTINGLGQQKGVDSLIVTDLIELSSYHAMSDAILVTGDSDLAIGIELAQKRGIRIAVLGVADFASGVPHNQSFEITSKADRIGMLGREELAQVFQYAPVQPATTQQQLMAQDNTGPRPSVAGTTTTLVIDIKIKNTVKAFVTQQASTLAGTVDYTTKRIDADIDRKLLYHVMTNLGHGALTNEEKICARDVFRSEVLKLAFGDTSRGALDKP